MSNDPFESKRSILSRETLVPLGVVFAVALGAAGAGAAWKEQFSTIDANFERQNTQFVQVNARLDAIERGVGDRFTYTDHVRYHRELGLLNPTLIMPEAQR